MNFARVDVHFQTVTVTSICHNFFFILIPISSKVLLILHTKFQPNIPCHFGEMDLHAWYDVIFLGSRENFQTAIVTLFRYRLFHFDINQHQGPTNTSYKISAKYT